MRKPLIYIDQNVLGLQLSRQIDLAKVKDVQWVYSKEHFAEIRRSASPEPFLNALDAIDAKLLEMQMENFKVTGVASLHDGGTAKEHYLAYLAAIEEVPFNDRIFDAVIAWVNGGGSESLLRELPEEFSNQLSSLAELCPEGVIPKVPSTDSPPMDEIVEKMVAVGNDINRTREALGVAKGAAGHITGPKALDQIWEKVSPACPGITSDQFFGFEPIEAFGYQEWPTYYGIIGCCSILDILGFKAERKARKVEKVPNVMSDSVHIAMGAYCAAILSGDVRLAERAKAIYEYKNISTVAVIVSVAG